MSRKRSKEPKTTTISVSVTAEEKERLYRFCDEIGMTVSTFVRDLIIKKI